MQKMQETWIRSLGQEDPWRRKWQPTSVFLSRKFYGQRSLAGYSFWSCKDLDMTERMCTRTHTHTHTHTHLCHLPLGLVHSDTKAKSIINTTINHIFGKHKWKCWLIKVLIKHLWEQYNWTVLIPRQQVFRESQTSYSILPGVRIKQCKWKCVARYNRKEINCSKTLENWD